MSHPQHHYKKAVLKNTSQKLYPATLVFGTPKKFKLLDTIVLSWYKIHYHHWDLHRTDSNSNDPDESTDGESDLGVLEVSEGISDGEEPVNADHEDCQHRYNEEQIL